MVVNLQDFLSNIYQYREKHMNILMEHAQASVTTKDIDFIVPDDKEYKYFIKVLQDIGYANSSSARWEKKNDLFSLVKGKKPAKLNTFASNYALFDARLNKLQLSLSNDARKEQKFVELFYNATEKLVTEKFKF